MYKNLYSRFLAAHPNELHFACHSHHYWPDVTREAHAEYWEDSCRYVDKKWDHIFSNKIPRAQQLIAKNLNLQHSSQIVFAPNTHEFIFRLLSSLDWQKKVRILTTDSEFYSFDRQINRLKEFPQFEVVKVPTLPFNTFEQRFAQAMKESSWNMIFLSHVFFNSGVVCDVISLAQQAPKESFFVIDGYHGFMAVPTDLSSIQEKAFYLAGSYKYAQGGEGACFLYVPPATRHRPFHTGWFAELSHLSNVGNQVGYPEDALQYAGSTMDFSALYRLIAALELFAQKGLTTEKIHAHVQEMQDHFIMTLQKNASTQIKVANLLQGSGKNHGHFLTFEMGSAELTQKVSEKLESVGVLTDSRGSRLRFGFSLYHEKEDIDKVVAEISRIH